MAASLTRLARSAPEKPGRPPRHGVEVDVGAEGLAPPVDGEDRRPLAQVGQRDLHRPVEAPRPQQRRVEVGHPVGGGDHDDAGARLEAVHVGEELVERLLALVVGAEAAGAAAPTDGVDLVDEDDRGSALAGVGEQRTDAGGPDAHEHLHEAGAAEREERHPGLTGHRPGQQRLPGSGRPDHQHALGPGRTGARVAPWLLEEVDDLHDLGLGVLVAGDVGEPGRRSFLVVDLRLGLADAHQAAERPAAAGELTGAAPQVPEVEAGEQQERQVGHQQPDQRGPARRHGGDRHVVVGQQRAQVAVGEGGRDLRDVLAPADQRAGHAPRVADRRGGHLVRRHVRHERRVAERVGTGRGHRRREVEQRHDQQPGRDGPLPPSGPRRRCRRRPRGVAGGRARATRAVGHRSPSMVTMRLPGGSGRNPASWPPSSWSLSAGRDPAVSSP